VPDPIVSDPMSAQLNPTMYAQALEIMVALDGVVGDETATKVMCRLGLNADEVDPAFVEAVLDRVNGIDLTAKVDADVTDALTQTLSGE